MAIEDYRTLGIEPGALSASQLGSFGPPAAGGGPGGSSAWEVFTGIDTTRASVLHRIFARGAPAAPKPAMAFIVTVCASCVLLLLTASATLPRLTSVYAGVRLPFLLDWNVLFMFSAALPALVAFTVADNRLLTTSISRIVKDDIVDISVADAISLAQRWERTYARVNGTSQIVGILMGGLVSWSNYVVYSNPSVGYWIAINGRMTLAGWVFLYCIFLYYAALPIYILRSIATAFFLKDLVRRSTVKLVPFHPDHCGGLRPVGSLGLRNQYLLSIYGLNLVCLIWVSAHYLVVPKGLVALIILAAAAYLTVGPLVFLAPLLPFRDGMLRNKADLMNDVAQRLRQELGRVRAKMRDGPITKEDEDLIHRLRSIGKLIEELPVWPFDARTLRKFLTAYGVPIAGSVGVPLIKWLTDLLTRASG